MARASHARFQEAVEKKAESFRRIFPQYVTGRIAQSVRKNVRRNPPLEVLKLCVGQGAQACNLGVPILAEELENVSSKRNMEG